MAKGFAVNCTAALFALPPTEFLGGGNVIMGNR